MGKHRCRQPGRAAARSARLPTPRGTGSRPGPFRLVSQAPPGVPVPFSCVPQRAVIQSSGAAQGRPASQPPDRPSVGFSAPRVRTRLCLGRTLLPKADDDGGYARPVLPLLLFLGVSSREVRKNEKPFSGRKVLCCFSLTSKSLRKRFSFKISGCRPLSRTAS